LIRLGADEDLDQHIVRGVRHRLSGIAFVRVQDVGLSGAPDQDVLAWAAQAGRVLVSHDASSMTAAANARIEHGLQMPGPIIVPQWVPVGRVIEDLLLIAQCSASSDLADQVCFLPLK
jgi:hypothetical protein